MALLSLQAFYGSIAQETENRLSIEQAFREALIEEEVRSNPDAALEMYKSIVEQAGRERKLVATALYRMGECSRKTGRESDAARAFQQLMLEYPEQTQLVEMSRSNLLAIGADVRLSPAAQADIESVSRLSHAQKAAMLELLNQELKILQDRVSIIKERYNAGRSSLDEVRATEHDILKVRQMMVLYSDVAEDAEQGRSQSELELERIRRLVRSSPDLIDAPGPDGQTLLHTAIRNRSPEQVALLIQAGASLNLANGIYSGPLDRVTPLIQAIFHGDLEIVKQLLAAGADAGLAVTAKPEAGEPVEVSPLLLAVEKDYRLIVRELVQKLDAEAFNAGGFSALSTAVYHQRNDLVSFLLENGADPNHAGAILSLDDQGDSIEKVVENAAFPPLTAAARTGNMEAARMLLAANADPDSGVQWLNPLYHVCGPEAVEMARLLLAHGADPHFVGVHGLNPVGHFLFRVAKRFTPQKDEFHPRSEKYLPEWNLEDAQNNVYQIIDLVLEAGLDPEWYDLRLESMATTPLIMSFAGDLNILEYLLKIGCDINAVTHEGLALANFAAHFWSVISPRDQFRMLQGDKNILSPTVYQDRLRLILEKYGADPQLNWIFFPEKHTSRQVYSRFVISKRSGNHKYINFYHMIPDDSVYDRADINALSGIDRLLKFLDSDPELVDLERLYNFKVNKEEILGGMVRSMAEKFLSAENELLKLGEPHNDYDFGISTGSVPIFLFRNWQGEPGEEVIASNSRIVAELLVRRHARIEMNIMRSGEKFQRDVFLRIPDWKGLDKSLVQETIVSMNPEFSDRVEVDDYLLDRDFLAKLGVDVENEGLTNVVFTYSNGSPDLINFSGEAPSADLLIGPVWRSDSKKIYIIDSDEVLDYSELGKWGFEAPGITVRFDNVRFGE